MVLQAEEEKKAPAQAEKFEAVEVESFTVKAEFPGLVEATKETPIRIVPEAWTDFTVLRAVEHGARVRKGDVLVACDPKKLRKAIDDKRLALPAKRIELEMARVELEKKEKLTPISLEEKRRSRAQSEEDLAYFEEVEFDMRIRDAHEDLEQVENRLAYAEEELRQLRKMYEKDDLTEETEEIILQRARNDVDEYRWLFEQTKERSGRQLEVMLPREHERRRVANEKSRVDWRGAEANLRRDLEKARLDLEAKKRSLANEEKSLSEHEADLEWMTIRAPHDGWVYYGGSVRGSWPTIATMEKKLVAGGKLSSTEVTLTVVRDSPLRLRAAVPGDKLKGLAPGRKGTATMKWNDDLSFPCFVERISYVPLPSDKYDAVFAFKPDGENPVLPGMPVELEIVVYEKDKALTLPAKAVTEEDGVSTVVLANGRERTVETGWKSGDKIEIVKGLKAGDLVRIGETTQAKEGEKKGDPPSASSQVTPPSKTPPSAKKAKPQDSEAGPTPGGTKPQQNKEERDPKAPKGKGKGKGSDGEK